MKRLNEVKSVAFKCCSFFLFPNVLLDYISYSNFYNDCLQIHSLGKIKAKINYVKYFLY